MGGKEVLDSDETVSALDQVHGTTNKGLEARRGQRAGYQNIAILGNEGCRQHTFAIDISADM